MKIYVGTSILLLSYFPSPSKWLRLSNTFQVHTFVQKFHTWKIKMYELRNHTTSVSGITRLWKSWNKNPCAIYFTSLAESNSLLFSENLQAYKLKVFWDNTCQALSFFILDPKHWRRYLLAVEDLNFSCHLDLISFECIRFKNVKLHGSGGMTTKWGRGEYRLGCHSNKYTFSFIRWSDS